MKNWEKRVIKIDRQSVLQKILIFMTAVMILQKFLFDFDGVFEKLISFEPIKSSAEDGSLLLELRLSLFSSCLVQVNILISIELILWNFTKIINLQLSKGIERMKERKKGGGERKYNSISMNILATFIGSTRIYYTFCWMNDNKCYSNEKSIHSSRNKSNHGIVALSAQRSRDIDRNRDNIESKHN